MFGLKVRITHPNNTPCHSEERSDEESRVPAAQKKVRRRPERSFLAEPVLSERKRVERAHQDDTDTTSTEDLPSECSPTRALPGYSPAA